MRLWDSQRQEVAPVDGAFPVQDQAEYFLEGAPAGFEASFAKPLPGGLFRIAFDNAVGLAEAAGARFRVHHSKLTPDGFEAMLDRVVSDVANLAFDFGAHAAMPHMHDGDAAPPDVIFHSLAYLRHVMLGRDITDSLQAEFQRIARHPHRRQEREPAWFPLAQAAHAGPRTIAAIAGNPERLGRLPSGSPLASTSLGRLLTRGGIARFPTEVLLEERVETFDTPENRVVKQVLTRAASIVRAFSHRALVNPDLRADLMRMDAELQQMLGHDFLGEVEPMTSLPLASTVLQRREGYRQFLQHLLALEFAAVLAPERNVWERLLDLKDCAVLYELWCFFEVKRLLEEAVGLGKPTIVALTKANDERVAVPWSATATYGAGGIELVYNRSYRNGEGSWSIPLRPDLVLRVRAGDGRWRTLVLDAKLKFAGKRLNVGDDTRTELDRDVVHADISKMHAYRDALPEVVSAFVLYPGTVARVWHVGDGQVGGLPFVPAAPHPEVVEILRSWVGDFSTPNPIPLSD